MTDPRAAQTAPAKSDALFLSSLADHAAIALENANLLSSLNQRVHSQLALLDTTVSMQRAIDTSSAYELIADRLGEDVSYDGLTFYKLEKDKILAPIDRQTWVVHYAEFRKPSVKPAAPAKPAAQAAAVQGTAAALKPALQPQTPASG